MPIRQSRFRFIYALCTVFIDLLGICKNTPRDDNLHNLVSSLKNLVHSDVAQVLFERIIFQVTVASVHLKGLVHDLECQSGISAIH